MTDEELKQQLRDSKGWPRLGDAAADLIEELEAKLAKAIEALDEAVYLLAPDDNDMDKLAGVYRIVTTLRELKGE